MENIILLIAPQKGRRWRENTSFEPQITKIVKRCDLCCAGAQEGKKSNGGGVKIDMDDDNFMHMQPRLLKGRNTKVCMWGEVPDVITPIKFSVDWFRGF